MKTIGIVGGIASGKSLVAKLFAELGAGHLDADRAGHEVLSGDAQVRQSLVDRWGPKILAADGSIDRAAVAACVFAASDPAQAAREREFLESLLHPRIGVLLQEKAREFAASGMPAVILDAPLLLEAGWGPLCDLIIMVDASPESRLARAQARGWDHAEFARRESAQWPVDRKRQHARVILQNDGSIDDLRAAVLNVWQQRVLESK